SPGLDAPTATRLLINRLLHQPSEALRDAAATGDAAGLEQAAAKLFGLGDS
ncbi:MAG TPA: glutamyl-tRNA reductase, partial [Azospirillaceae bacterium]|nr:glutamyl-tRNA reductase [Azospirillaceae bacterium]